MSAKNCPRCGSKSDWEKDKPIRKKMPNGKFAMVTPIKGLRCPKCKNLFRHPSEQQAMAKIWEVIT